MQIQNIGFERMVVEMDFGIKNVQKQVFFTSINVLKRGIKHAQFCSSKFETAIEGAAADLYEISSWS